MKLPLFLLNQQAVLKAYIGNDASGQQIYGNISTLDSSGVVSYNAATGEYTLRCRFEPSKASQRIPDRETRIYRGTLFILGEDVPPQSKIIFGGDKYIVGECIKRYGLNGISHLEVLLT